MSRLRRFFRCSVIALFLWNGVVAAGTDLDWWSLRPVKAELPEGVALSDSSANPVDALIDKALREKKLHPADVATPRELIRRASYDLTGLPPTPEEVGRFLEAYEADAKGAWESLVDRLMSSPAFGEKFARHWLDLARYAETHGYDKDKPRLNAWPYRDYVIRSFNEDKPYSRFVQEQVAGDVLFPGEEDGIIALGFLAAGPWDFIGHWEVGEAKLDGRIAKHLDRDEMIAAVFNVFQSTTVQCAQCHDHKLDPIVMEDYYRLHAVFAAVDRADRVYAGLGEKEAAEKEALLSRINALKGESGNRDREFKQLLAAKVSGIDRRIAELKEKYGAGLKPQYGYHSHIVKKQEVTKWVQMDLGAARPATRIRIIPAYDNYGGIGAGFGFPVRYRVEVSDQPDFANGTRILLDATQNDQENPRTGTVSIDGDGKRFRYLRVTATKLAERKGDYIFALGEIEALNEGGSTNYALNASVTALDSIEQGVRWGKANLNDGIFFRELGNDEALAELRELQGKRAEIEKATMPPGHEARLAEIKALLKPLEEKLRGYPGGQLVYAASTHFSGGGRFAATSGKPREIHLLHRGDLTSPGEAMRPGVPPLWSAAPEMLFGEDGDWSEGEARAGLARYLTRADNPLVWRSIANRIWQWVFAEPLVKTPNDFGRGGLPPANTELLDYLASTLRDDPDQSIKSVLRVLFTSEAYRRSSQGDSRNIAIDQDNAHLWRANRRRLSAEEFRDSILQVSGVLDRKMGGPGFQDFIIEKPQHSPHYQYHLHDPNDPASFRRSVYRFVVRSQPQPMLTTLDCADPAISIPLRGESTTALQALTNWNNRFVVAMAEHLGKRILSEAPGSNEAQVELACHLALGRGANEEEQELLTAYLEEYGVENFARVLFNLNAFVYVD